MKKCNCPDELLVQVTLVTQALQDMTDGESWWDIQCSTGLSTERCKEICTLAWGEELARQRCNTDRD